VSTLPIYRRYPREFYALWFLAAITYGFGDMVSTALAVLGGSGIAESNPIVAGVLREFGLPGFLVVKFAILVALLWISVGGARSEDRFSYYWPPVVATVLGGALTGWNLWLLYGS
jgi:glycerol uptake facilitator-like aquaporin